MTGRNGFDQHTKEENHHYFLAVEKAFIRLRGAPFLLSPEDWRVARGWYREGIPVEVASRVMGRIFAERKAASKSPRRITTLRYFDSAVRRAWGERRALLGSDEARSAEPIDVTARLVDLAGRVVAAAPQASKLAESVRATTGSTEEIERRLTELDRELLESVRESLTAAEEAEIQAIVDKGLERIGDRLRPEERAEASRRLEQQALRRMRRLPHLSLLALP